MPPDDRDAPTDPPDPIPTIEPEPEPPAQPAPVSVFCARCGETSVPVASSCPWCGAWLVGPRPRAKPVYSLDEPEPEDDWDADAAREEYIVRPLPPPPVPPMLVVFVSYALLIGSLIGFVFFAVIYQLSTEEEMHKGLALVEIANAMLALVALALVWNTARQRIPKGTMLLTWVSAVPILTALLGINFLYITFLRELLKPFITAHPAGVKVTLTTVLLICVQPAIVEEIFFRQMMLGVFRRSMNLHLAVWLTGALFAFAHLANPLGMPYLLLAGGVFGYVRVYGGLPLAMLMHFLHNLAVISYEAWK